MPKRMLALALGLLAISPVEAQTESAEDFLHPLPDHDQLGYVPQQQSPTDYTNGAVRLGDIPGQDLVRPFGAGGGTSLGKFAADRPANVTKNTLAPPLPHLLTSRQTVGIDRDPDTGLPLDVVGRYGHSLSDNFKTDAERSAEEAAALSAASPR